MIDVFKKNAPAYKRLVRRLGLDIWKGRATKEVKDEFFEKAERYKDKYERDLIKYYRDEEIRIYPGTIREKGNQWLFQQQALVESLEAIAEGKKDKLSEELFEKLKSEKSADAQKLLNRIYLSKADREAGAEVFKVFSFSENFEDKSEQIGEQAAFDLGSDINNEIMKENGDAYEWVSQHDNRVRTTHRMLNKKTFLWSNPPKTIDEYGNSHTGPPGTDFGCRCSSLTSNKKPLKNYTADARRRKSD